MRDREVAAGQIKTPGWATSFLKISGLELISLKILLGIGHPADVHFFKYFINDLKNNSHEVFVSAREKEITYYLLDKLNIQKPDLKREWKKKREKMLVNKIDVTVFLVWFVENYPNSAKVMRENPDYQYRFKSAPQRNTFHCHK